MSIDLALMTGIDIPIPELQLTLHQPTIKEISMIGEQDFFTGIQLLSLDKKLYPSEDKNLLEFVNNFQLFMNIIFETKDQGNLKKKVSQCLQIIFPDYVVNFIPNRSILFNYNGGISTIDEGNFELLQNILKQVFKINTDKSKDFNPVNNKAAEIAKKLQRGRERVAKQKKDKGEGAPNLKQYLSIITIGIPSMSLKDACDLTVYQLYTLIERYSLFVNWDLDVRTRLAGGSPDSHPDNWMKNI